MGIAFRLNFNRVFSFSYDCLIFAVSGSIELSSFAASADDGSFERFEEEEKDGEES